MNNTIKRIFFIAYILFLPLFFVSEAQAKNTKHYLQIINNAEFSRFASSLPKHLIHRDIIENSSTWKVTNTASTERENMGLTLFNKLDYSFLFSANQDNKEPRYFAHGAYSNLKIQSNSFELNRGTDLFRGEVIAKVNWDNKGKEDWIVFFSLTNPHSELVGRFFYLVVTDTSLLPLEVEIIANQNNFTNTFYIFSDEMPEYKILQMQEEQRKAEKAKQDESKEQNKEEKTKEVQNTSTIISPARTSEQEQIVLELDRGAYSVLESPNQEQVKVEEKKKFWQRGKQDSQAEEVNTIETKLDF